MARNAELEAAIARAPDDPKVYEVYADWLIEQGDPRGEFIALHRRGDKRTIQAYLAAHKLELMGDLPEDLVTEVTWSNGFIRSCRVAQTFERFDGGDPDAIGAALRGLLSHASSTFLRALTVGILDYEGNDYTELFALLGAHPKPALRELYVGDFTYEETELNWSSIGTTAPMWKSVPALEKLTLRSGSMSLEGIEAPSLRELHVITGGFDNASLAALLLVAWPKLETLELQLGREHAFDVKELSAIFEGARFPALRALHLTNSNISDAIAEAIARAPITKQLRSLDLSLGTLGIEGARALAAAKSELAHLEVLDLSQSWISAEGIELVRGIAKDVRVGDQKDDGGDPDDRYIAAYE